MPTLQEITSQESGMLLFSSNELIVCNWAGFRGIPRLFTGCLIDWDSEIKLCDAETDEVDDISEIIAGATVIYDRNDDMSGNLKIPGTVYTLEVDGSDVLVIAPDGWNRRQSLQR